MSNYSRLFTDQNYETLVGMAEEATIKDMEISDEICPDEEYEQVEHQSKSICSVEVYPLKYEVEGQAGFRAKIEEAELMLSKK